MSGIFYNNCGEFNSANFGQILQNVCFFYYKYLQLFMKIPLLYEINLFDNTVNPYSSISGCTFKNDTF